LGEAFNKGLDEQFTKQGLRTFLQGALTGSMIRPVTHTVGKMTSYINEKATERAYKDNPAENPYVKMREQLKRDINLQNDIMAQMSGKKFEDNVVNFTNQVDSTLAQTEAAAKGHQYEWQNAQDNSVLGAALAANRSGTILTFQQALREMGKTMSNEEFEAAFGIKLSDTKYNSAAEMTEAMAKDVKKYSDTVDGIRRKVRNIPDPLMYEKGSKEQMTAIIMHNAQEEAIRIVALNAMKATRASERAQKVSQDLLAIPGMSNSSEYALRVLANPENFKAESGNMLADIKLLEESLESTDMTPAQREKVEAKIKDKKRLVEVYDKWMEFWDDRDTIAMRQDSETGEVVEQKEKIYNTFVGVPINSIKYYDENGNLIDENTTVYSLDHKDIAETFREFINLRNKEFGISDQLSEQSLREALDKVVDFMRLDQDAKDYTQAMDLLFNPEYYRQTLTNIQDGRFKYEILEFVDNLNNRLRDIILSVASNSDLEDVVEKLQLAAKLYEELSNAVTNSDYYKNLVLISIDENTGLQNAKFAQENITKLNDLISDKIAEMLDSYATQDVTGDINDMQYEEFQKTKKVPRYTLSLIARRIAQKVQLTDRQSEVYNANKEEVDSIVTTLNFDENANGSVQDGSKVTLAKEALVGTGEFEMAQLDAMPDNDVLNLAMERNLITNDDVIEHFNNTPIEMVSDTVYENFKQTQEVDDITLESIARRDLEGIDLTPREVEIMTAKAAEISDIQSVIEDERLRSEEDNAPIQEPQEEEVPQVFEQPEGTLDETKDPLDASVSQSTIDAANAAAQSQLEILEKLNGTGKDGTNKAENEQEPFVVEGDPEEGYDVVSRNGITLTDEKIESEEKANDLANELNNSRLDIDWTRLHLGDLTAFEDPTYKVDQMVRRGHISLRAYNKANETNIQTLEEYYKIPQGKRNLDDIKESILTGVPLDKIKQKRKKAARQEQEQLNLFEDTTSGFVGGPALPLQSVQDLFDRLESASQSEVKIELNFNVRSSTKNGSETLANNDTSIKMGDETQELGKLKKYGKAKYYINNGVLGVIIEGKDLFGRDGGRTIVNVKVPEGFNEAAFEKLVNSINYPGSTTVAETERVLNEIRDAIQKSITTNKSAIAERKQYSIDEINRRFMGEATYFGPNWNPNDLATIVENTQTVYASTKEEAIEKINELYAKEQAASATSSSVEERKAKSLGMFNIIPNFRDDSGYVGTYYTPMGTEEIIEGLTYEDVQSKLEAKYNSEISEKIGKFVKEDAVSEESILDQLRKINSCFK
jgi:hypothetical protein